ncbi:MAG: biosynthetic-type acetolactate synthase large subunit, partial [Clostridiales bacterium]|nr:biosynthetic-type acetolactate synthase large subunit [Clostridiales bacterium]
MKLTGAQLIVETLIDQGVDTVFGYPGGTVLNIYAALYDASDRIQHIITAHEQGAAHAADGYARASGRVGVCIATSGPGATNLVTGIATAALDSTPLVAITGNVPCALIGRDSFQEVDIAGVTLPITKHNYIVKDINKLADTLREAFAIAKSGRPGPVLVDVPKDVQQATIEWEPQGIVPKEPTKAPKESRIDKAAELISLSRRPYIYCGGGVILGGASDELLALSQKIDAPVGCSMMGLSAVPYDFPGALGMQGMHGRYASSKAQAEADLILAVGARFSDRATGNKEAYTAGARIIHIDIDPAEIDKNIPTYLGIVGDVKATLQALLGKLEETKRTAWAARIRELRDEESRYVPQNDAFTPYNIIDQVKAAASDDVIIATDVGQHQMWTAQRYDFKYPRCFITSGGLGTMGFGMGAAIGSAFATGRRVILFT